MPEYLTPGVYVEETSFRSRSIEGVPTSTFGMAGVTEYGPVPYRALGTPMVPGPPPLTSFGEYERAFGGLTVGDNPCRLALAARAFFANGGRRLYVARVFPFTMTAGAHPGLPHAHFASPAGAGGGAAPRPSPRPTSPPWRCRRAARPAPLHCCASGPAGGARPAPGSGSPWRCGGARTSLSAGR